VQIKGREAFVGSNRSSNLNKRLESLETTLIRVAVFLIFFVGLIKVVWDTIVKILR
jgi:hypothetical protein